jgi:hypothetical protein
VPPEAVSEPVYIVPTVPVAGNDPVIVIVGVAAEITIETEKLAV